MKKIKAFFKDLFQERKIKRNKTEPRQLPKGKKYNPRTIRSIVWIGLIILLSSAVFAFIRSGNALSDSKEAKEQVEVNKTETIDNQEAYDSPKFQVYSQRFVDDYMNIPGDSEDREEYEETLNTYYVDEDFIPALEFKGKRELVSKTLFGIEQEENHVVAEYKVDYKIIPKDDDDVKEKEAMLNIPIKYDNGYGVVEPAYFTDVPNMDNNEQEAIESDYEEGQEEELTVNQKQELEDWTEDFLHDYAEKDEEDMAYMMNDPEALNGLQEFVSIDDFKAYEKEDYYVAKVEATFKEPGVDLEHEEQFTLDIEEKDNKYYVKSMKNTLGGK